MYKRNIYYSILKHFRKIPNYFFRNKKHKFLFILSPPYCGSTLLNEIISTSKNVSSNNYLNTREGQTLPEVKNFMFKKNRWDPENKIPWKKVKQIWMKYWDLSKDILLDKSTTNILRCKEISNHFNPLQYICLVRNPYAQCEGIIRRNNKDPFTAANFVIKCLKLQKMNLENQKNILFISYEDLCDKTESIIKKIIKFVPEVKNLNTKLEFKAHNFKSSNKMQIVNLNNEKISKLTKDQIETMNKVFILEEKLIKYFNYEIMKS